MENNFKVYMHINKINNKKYIGITSQKTSDRWKNGKGYSNNEHFYNTINKYGWDNFEHKVLFENLSKEDACKIEIQLISKHKTTNREFGYNHTTGGEHYTHTEESKYKISERFRGKKLSEEHCKKLSDSHKGQILTEYARQRYIELCSGENHPMYGKTHTKEAREKISKARTGKKLSEEHKKKISISSKGKKISEAQKIKLSKSKEKYKKRVIQMTKDGTFIKEWESLSQIFRELGITQGNVSNCCSGKLKSSNGFIWKFSD